MSVREVVIDVTEEDIKEGLPRSRGFCPIALATMRAFSDADKALINPDSFEVIKGRRVIASADLPDEAVDFIDAFDGNVPVKPIRFTLKFTATTEEHRCS